MATKKPHPPRPVRGSRRSGRLWMALAVLVVLALLGLYFLQSRPSYSNFTALAVQGKPALAHIQIEPDAGRSHVPVGQAVQYATNPPTSGPHWPSPTQPGFYTQPQPPETLVHSLEHGNVVIYYSQPGSQALAQLKTWANQFSGTWDGLVVVPVNGLGGGIILTAWDKTLRLDTFDPAAAAAFIDAFRGRGPENLVR